MKVSTLVVFFACGLSLVPASAVDFETDVLPIFEAKCAKCHMDGSSKGGVALDAGDIGKEIGAGKAIVPGDLEKSDLLKLVSLPEDDSDRMPPSGKGDPLRENEIAKIKEWIEAGALVGGEVPVMKEDEKPADALTKRPDPIKGNWTNKEGKIISATLIRVEGETAVLLMNGSEFKYPVANLSAADQTKIREFSEASKQLKGG